MSFKITTARIEAIRAKAIALHEARITEVVEPVAPEYSAEAMRVKRTIEVGRAHFSGGHIAGIFHLFANFAGLSAEESGKLKADLFYGDRPDVAHPAPVGSMIVLLGNPNHHSYPIGEPILKGNEVKALYIQTVLAELSWGNALPTDGPSWRFATVDEINSFCDRALKAQADRDASIAAEAARKAAEPDVLLSKLGII